MAEFKPMVKMMTTEPSVELKLKKGGKVEKPKKMMNGGVMGALSATPGRGGMMPAARPARPTMANRRKAMMGRPMMGRPMMAEGGESKSMHKAETSKMEGLEKELRSHESKPASKAHKGLNTGGVVMGQGGYKDGGMANGGKMPMKDGKPAFLSKKDGGMACADGGEIGKGILPESMSEKGAKSYKNTKMHGGKKDVTPQKTGEVKMGKPGGYATGGVAKANAGGYKEGGKVNRMMGGGMMDGGMGGYSTYKKGGAAKKAYAAGGLVDSGRPVAYPKKPASAPVKNNLQSGTFKRGGKVKMAEGGSSSKPEDLSKGAYDKSLGPSKEEMDMARTIREIPDRVFRKAKQMLGIDNKPAGSVTETEKSVTVTPAKKRGGSVNC